VPKSKKGNCHECRTNAKKTEKHEKKKEKDKEEKDKGKGRKVGA
jgi:hypothetical protein